MCKPFLKRKLINITDGHRTFSEQIRMILHVSEDNRTFSDDGPSANVLENSILDFPNGQNSSLINDKQIFLRFTKLYSKKARSSIFWVGGGSFFGSIYFFKGMMVSLRG